MISVTNTTKKVPSLSGTFLLEAKNLILKKKYELSLTYVGQVKMESINTEYREIKKPTDILSFPIEENFGEIYICMDIVEKKAKLFEMKTEDYLKYLIVHGMIHLLGHDHGDKMDSLEKIYTQKLHIEYPYRYTK
ncbi:MAG: rRNA maturation RNase YbeY [Patescibacteria group bacterium]